MDDRSLPTSAGSASAKKDVGHDNCWEIWTFGGPSIRIKILQVPALPLSNLIVACAPSTENVESAVHVYC